MTIYLRRARLAQVVVEEDAEMWVLDRKAYTAVNVQHLQKIQKRKEDLVDNVAIFQWLQKEMRQQLVDAMIPQEFPAGRVIMKKGDIGDVFYIIDKARALSHALVCLCICAHTCV